MGWLLRLSEFVWGFVLQVFMTVVLIYCISSLEDSALEASLRRLQMASMERAAKHTHWYFRPVMLPMKLNLKWCNNRMLSHAIDYRKTLEYFILFSIRVDMKNEDTYINSIQKYKHNLGNKFHRNLSGRCVAFFFI